MSDSGRSMRDSEDTRTSEEIHQAEDDNRVRQLYSELIRREPSEIRKESLRALFRLFNESRAH